MPSAPEPSRRNRDRVAGSMDITVVASAEQNIRPWEAHRYDSTSCLLLLTFRGSGIASQARGPTESWHPPASSTKTNLEPRRCHSACGSLPPAPAHSRKLKGRVVGSVNNIVVTFAGENIVFHASCSCTVEEAQGSRRRHDDHHSRGIRRAEPTPVGNRTDTIVLHASCSSPAPSRRLTDRVSDSMASAGKQYKNTSEAAQIP